MNKVTKILKINRTLQIIFATLLYALTFNLLLRPNQIVIGGMSGVAMIINKYFNFGIPIVVAFLSFIFYILAYAFLSKKVVIQTLIASICYPLFIYLTYNISDYIMIDHNELLIIALFSGIILGFSEGLVEKTGLLSGGTATLARIISEKFKITKTTSNLVVDGIIILFGIATFGISQAMYGFIIVYILMFVGSKVMLDISKNKIFYIYTDDTNDIKDFIHHTLGYDVTTMVNEKVDPHHKYILTTVVKTIDYFALKEGIEDIDPHAKIIIFDSYEAFERKGKEKERKKLIEEYKNENI